MKKILQTIKKIIAITAWSYQFQFKTLGFWAVFQFLRNIYDNLQTLLYSFFLGKLINVLASANITYSREASIYPIIYMGVVWLIGHLLHFDDYLLRFYRYEKTRMEFMQAILKKITYLDWQKIEEPNTEKVLRSTLDNGSWPLHSYVDSISYLITVVIGFIFALTTVELNWLLLAALMVGALPTGLQTLWYTYLDARVYDSLLPRYVKLSGILDFFHSANTLFESKITRAERFLSEVESRERKSNLDLYFAQFSKLFWTNLITITTSLGSNLFVLWYLTQRVISGALPIGTFQYYLTAFNKLRSDIGSIFSSIGQMEDGYRYLVHFYALMHMEPSLADGNNIVEASSPPTINFKDVSYTYPHSKEPALSDVTISIKPGEKIALVGENGAGKSTFIKLLLRAYDPKKGTVNLNDQSLTTIKKSSWYDQLALIPQDFARYDVLTVAENIGLGEVKNNEGVRLAAEMSNAHQFITKLPHDYQTILSRKIEGGVELSSGQWQRLGLARLFFADKNVVILDEPTASIDPVAEHQIFKNVYQKLKDKTVIIVSHRYSTVKDADRILVFHDGKIIEEGSFDQLLGQKGYFSKAYSLQLEAKQLSNKQK